jgi:hypothetical protein
MKRYLQQQLYKTTAIKPINAFTCMRVRTTELIVVLHLHLAKEYLMAYFVSYRLILHPSTPSGIYTQAVLEFLNNLWGQGSE